MWRDAGLAQVGHEPGRVISLVGTERQPSGRSGGVTMDHVQRCLAFGMTVRLGQVTLHDKPVPVFHQSMAHEAKHRTRAGGFLVEPRIGVGRRGMSGIRALLALEVDLGISAAFGVAGHLVGLGWGLGKRGFGRGIRGGWIAGSLVVRRGSIGLWLEALHRGPSLHQRTIDREVVVRQERCHLAVGQDRRHHLARHLGGQQPVAVLGKHGRHPDRVVDAKAYKPAEHQVVIHLLHQLPFGANREQDLQQACPDQPLRRDRGAAEIRVEHLELGIEAGKRVIHHLPDLAQRVFRWDPLLQIDIAEQRPARLVRPAHLHPRRYREKDESCSQTAVEAGLFQQPGRPAAQCSAVSRGHSKAQQDATAEESVRVMRPAETTDLSTTVS